MIGKLEGFQKKIETSLKRQTTINQSIIDDLTALTQSSDPETQVIALEAILDDVRGNYYEQLRSQASGDLTSYAEYMNPEEPPAPHHVYLCDRLTDMADGIIPRMTISMPPGHAKALALDTLIDTPTGFKTIADLHPGDFVYSPSGQPTQVTAKSEVFEGRRTFRAITDDNQEIVCDADHLWTVRLDRKRNVYRTFTTLQLFERQSKMKDFRPPRLPDVAPTVYNSPPLILDPYTLGLWLGDGTSEAGSITMAEEDQFEARTRIESSGITTRDRKGRITYSVLDIRKHLVALDVLSNKHIPTAYLRSTVDDRISLLQGLMDSDGTVSPNGQCSFSNKNIKLIEGVSDILFSLGIKNTIIESRSKCNGKDYGPYWRVSFYFRHAFHLKRKADRAQKYQQRLGRYLRFEEVTSVPTQCITVSSKDGLFLAGRGRIVTHNSTYASRIFPSWWLGKNPKKRYIQAGHSQNFVENEFGKKTKAMVESERFSAVFPEVVLAADAKAAGYWSLAKHGGSYLTRGVGQGIAGFRAHMAGVDDPFATREDAESETIRNKVWDWFSADFTTRLLPDAPLFIVATRWHSDDLIGRVEDMNRKKKGLPWFIINLPAICTDIDDPMGREIDEPLWKDFYTIDTLMNLKATLPSRDWNSLYQGRPVDEEGGIIIGSWLQRYEKLPSRDNWKRVTVSVDSANKNTDRADFTAIGVWIEMINNCHYLVHVDRDKLELPKLIKRVENIIKEWGAEALLIEDKGSGTQYIQLMSQKSSAPIVPMSPNNNSKEFRLDGVSPMFEAGRVFIPKAGLWVPDYESELLSFPMGKYDDQVDMTSQYLAWVRKKITRGSRPLTGQEHTTGSTNKDKVKAEIEKNIAAVALRHAEDPIALALRMQREAEESGLIVPHHVGRTGTLQHLRQGR